MLKVLSNILSDLDPTVKVIGQKAGICDGVPSTSALVESVFVAVKEVLLKPYLSNSAKLLIKSADIYMVITT